MSKLSRVFHVISCRGGDLTDISQGRALNDEQISKVEQQQECHKLLLGIYIYILPRFTGILEKCISVSNG